MEIFTFQDHLKREFLERCRKNPSYSIRAFARTLKIDHSTLSKIIRGQRPITKTMILRLGQGLKLGTREIENYVRLHTSKETEQSSYKQLTLDTFKVISDWYHYAIFELVTLKDFHPDFTWIARKLDIRVSDAELAVQRLERIGLLDTQNPKKWRQSTPLITTTANEFTAVAFRKLQSGVLEKALHALEEIPLEQRDNTSMTMAIHSSQLPEVKRRIRIFRRGLCKVLQKNKERDAVYQLGIAFYPLTQRETEVPK